MDSVREYWEKSIDNEARKSIGEFKIVSRADVDQGGYAGWSCDEEGESESWLIERNGDLYIVSHIVTTVRGRQGYRRYVDSYDVEVVPWNVVCLYDKHDLYKALDRNKYLNRSITAMIEPIRKWHEENDESASDEYDSES